MMSTTTATTSTPCAFKLTMEQELGQLFNTLQYIWHHNPHHFGHKKFDEFLGSLQNSYYYLLSIQQQKKLLLQQHQQQQQKSANKSIPSIPSTQPKSTIPSTPSPCTNSPPSKPSLPSTSKSQIAVMATKRPKRSCAAAPKLQTIDEKSSFSSSPPPPSSSTLSTLIANKLNASAPAFEPTSLHKTTSSDETNNKILDKNKSYKKVSSFKPAHAARAKLNIYIPKHMTKKLLSNISESFPNTGTLYYYLDISTALQINDDQVDIIETKDGKQLAFINFDLHQKDTKQLLYAVIISNDSHKIEGNKWLWKIEKFLTINEIESEYGIYAEDLPKSSRSMKNGLYYQWKMQKNKTMDVSILNKVNWSENVLKQIGSSQKGKKAKKTAEIKIVLNKNYWMSECRKSWNALPSIPIVLYENRDINKHWIEWVKLIYIASQNAYIGISCKYMDGNNNEWKVSSICLDKGDMHNKHRLIGLKNNYAPQSNINYDAYFDKFNTKITEIQWKS